MLKLYTSLTSPYGRKCRMAAYVAGIADRVEVVTLDYHSDDYRKINPLGKVPALERDDGFIIIDSPLICSYLASIGDQAQLVPPPGDARLKAHVLEALADGITDAGVLIFLENKRSEDHRSHGWLKEQASKIDKGLDALEDMADDFGDDIHIGILAVAASVSWLEFRTIVDGVRDGRPKLSAWLDAFAHKDFMVATAPPADA